MSTKQKFPGKAINMSIAAKVISNHFSENIGELSKARTNWDTAFSASLAARVEAVANNYIGISASANLFNASIGLYALVASAKKDLVSFKKQFEIDFKDNTAFYNETIALLGFVKGKVIADLSQSELIKLLLAFKRNLTAERLATITSKGMPAALPQRIADAADPIDQANTLQEKIKGTAKVATEEIVTELNLIYKEIISICKIASDHYKDNPVKKELFTFSKVMQNIGGEQVEKTVKTAVKA